MKNSDKIVKAFNTATEQEKRDDQHNIIINAHTIKHNRLDIKSSYHLRF